MPPKVVRQWKPSGARMEANEDVEQLREILKDIRGPGIDDSKPLHAGSRIQDDHFNDKIAALKRKPIPSYEGNRPQQYNISPQGSPGKSIGMFRRVKGGPDNSDDDFSKKVKLGGAFFAGLVVFALFSIFSGDLNGDGDSSYAPSGEWNPGSFYEVADHTVDATEGFSSTVRCPAMLSGHGCQDKASVPECVPPLFDSWLTLSKASADTDHSRTGAADLVHVPSNQWRPYVGSEEHLLPSQDAFGWVPGGPRTIPSCALVANGGILKGLGLGEEIDSHSVVMRINEAPTAGFERDVGARTTVRLATFEHAMWREKPEEVVVGLLNLNCTSAGGRALSECEKQRRRLTAHKVHIVNPDFHSNVAMSPFFKGFLRGAPTSGFVGMVMLLHTCQRVHLFGFNTEETLLMKGNAAFQDWYFKKNASHRESPAPHDWPVYTGPLYSTEAPNAPSSKGGWFGRRQLLRGAADAAAGSGAAARAGPRAGLSARDAGAGEGLAGAAQRTLLVELENFFDEDMLRQPKAKKQPKISRASKGNGAGADDVTDVDASDGGNGGGKTKAKAKDKGVKKVPKEHAKAAREEKFLAKAGGDPAVMKQLLKRSAKKKEKAMRVKIPKPLSVEDIDPEEAARLEEEASRYRHQLDHILGVEGGPDSGPEASHSSPAASAAGGARPAMNPAAGAAAVAKVASILEADTDETDLLDTEGPILDVKGNPIPAEDIERVRNLRSQFHAMKQHMIDELREEGLVQEVAAVDYSGGGGGGGGGPSSGGFGADGGFGGGGGGMGMGDDGDPGPRRPPLSSKQQRALSQQAVVARGEHNCMVALRESGVVQMSP